MMLSSKFGLADFLNKTTTNALRHLEQSHHIGGTKGSPAGNEISPVGNSREQRGHECFVLMARVTASVGNKGVTNALCQEEQEFNKNLTEVLHNAL